VRPLSMAKRVPRDYVIMGWPVGAGSPTGTCSGEANSPIAGVQSPPLRWGEAEQGWPSGENPGITRRVVFPEGRTLCARLAWPNVCRGITFSRDGRSGPGRLRGHARVKPIPPLRACGARPSAKGPSRGERPCGEDPGMMRKALFSEGRALRVRVARPDLSRGIS